MRFTASSVEYFVLAMKRLQDSFLKSKKHFLYKKFAKISAVVIASIAPLLLIVWGVFMFLSKDVCTYYVAKLLNNANSIHMVALENELLKEKWTEFENAFNYGASPEK